MWYQIEKYKTSKIYCPHPSQTIKNLISGILSFCLTLLFNNQPTVLVWCDRGARSAGYKYNIKEQTFFSGFLFLIIFVQFQFSKVCFNFCQIQFLASFLDKLQTDIRFSKLFPKSLLILIWFFLFAFVFYVLVLFIVTTVGIFHSCCVLL